MKCQNANGASLISRIVDNHFAVLAAANLGAATLMKIKRINLLQIEAEDSLQTIQ